MGKRARKTRWRTLAIEDDHSDSEESNSTLDTTRVPPYGNYQNHYNNHNKYYSNRYGGNFTHSSQSTPTRRYQQQGGSDGSKSTRSSSTASENKITFNEDEYTRITTPRQDVLFKKGYLNKPKNYQTQISSTGNSTTSTGNSTGNGTPDYPSTDLEYESQFVFPNGFLDQNGIYYVNGFDPYAFMLYNAPPPYYEDNGSKDYSSESLTESASTTNDESVQESGTTSTSASIQNGCETAQINDVPCPKEDHNDFHDHCNGNVKDEINEEKPADSKTKRIKRRRRRKDSAGVENEGNSQDDSSSSDCEENSEEIFLKVNGCSSDRTEEATETKVDVNGVAGDEVDSSVDVKVDHNINESPELELPESNNTAKISQPVEPSSKTPQTHDGEKKYSLKPDAQEFIPRALRSEVQYVIPVPLINGFNAAFLPPQAGYPLNYLPQPHQPIYPGFVGYPYPPKYEEIPYENVVAPSSTEQVQDVATTEKNDHVNAEMNVMKLEENVGEVKEDHVSSSRTRNGDDRKRASFNNRFKQNGFRQPKRFLPRKSQEIEFKEVPEEFPKLDDKPKEDFPKLIELAKSKVEESSDKAQPEDKSNVDAINENKINGASKMLKKTENQTIPSRTLKEQILSPSHRSNQNHTEKPRLQNTVTNGNHQNGVNGRHWKYDNSKYNKPTYNKNENNNQRRFKKVLTRPVNGQTNGYANGQATPKEILKSPRNYSETLRKDDNKILQSPVHNEANSEVKKEIKIDTENGKPKDAKRWISVSSKKKRKNKNVEEFDDSFPEDETNENDFETYFSFNDALVEDLVNQNHGDEVDVKEVKVISNKEATPVKESSPVIDEKVVPENMLEVSELEKSMINSLKPEKTIEDSIKPEEIKSPPTQKKKTKKNSGHQQKPLIKRVLITDINLAVHPDDEIKDGTKCDINDKKIDNVTLEKIEESTVPVTDNKVLTNVGKDSSDPVKTDEIEASPVKTEEIIESEKKNKKKKKKVVKSISASSSTSQLNTSEDSYDLLLDSAFTEQSHNKTNVEISQELDLIIQRGMYNSLEGKIRALNIAPLSDEFFQAVIKHENNSGQNAKWNRFSGSALPKIKLPENGSRRLSTTSETNGDSFLKNGDGAISMINGDETTDDVTCHEQKVYTSTCNIEVAPTITSDPEEDNAKKGYPITEAVKNWLNKTRENTPDVDVLKSPGTIRREFLDKSSEKNSERNSRAGSEVKIVVRDEKSPESEEEITIYTADHLIITNGNNVENDLLDCWEDEMVDGSLKQNQRKISDSTETDAKNSSDTKSSDQSDLDEELQIYESKYGQNEDYLRLKDEIEAKSREDVGARARNFPKHGALPYRAICCNVM